MKTTNTLLFLLVILALNQGKTTIAENIIKLDGDNHGSKTGQTIPEKGDSATTKHKDGKTNKIQADKYR